MIDEEATRAKMRELAENGDLAGAIGEYARLEHRLRAELKIEPERQTKRLLEVLGDGASRARRAQDAMVVPTGSGSAAIS